MKITIDMENLTNILSDAAEENVKAAMNDAMKSVVREKVDSVLKDKADEEINAQITRYITEYLSTATVTVGDSWSGDEVRTITVEQYLKEKVSKIFKEQILSVPVKNGWGDERTKSVTFKEYIDENLNVDYDIKKGIESIAKTVRAEVDQKIKTVFDETMRRTLADNVFSIVASSDTYRTITNNLKLLGE